MEEIETAPMFEVAPRANRHGDPCPKWCAIDHSAVWEGTSGMVHHMDHHQSERRRVPGAYDTVTIVRPGFTDAVTKVALAGLHVPLAEAETLARLIDALADETPAVMRLLAAEVRAAAATGMATS